MVSSYDGGKYMGQPSCMEHKIMSQSNKKSCCNKIIIFVNLAKHLINVIIILEQHIEIN